MGSNNCFSRAVAAASSRDALARRACLLWAEAAFYAIKKQHVTMRFFSNIFVEIT